MVQFGEAFRKNLFSFIFYGWRTSYPSSSPQVLPKTGFSTKILSRQSSLSNHMFPFIPFSLPILLFLPYPFLIVTTPRRERDADAITVYSSSRILCACCRFVIASNSASVFEKAQLVLKFGGCVTGVDDTDPENRGRRHVQWCCG